MRCDQPYGDPNDSVLAETYPFPIELIKQLDNIVFDHTVDDRIVDHETGDVDYSNNQYCDDGKPTTIEDELRYRAADTFLLTCCETDPAKSDYFDDNGNWISWGRAMHNSIEKMRTLLATLNPETIEMDGQPNP
jgi:hypothetical protein